MTTKITEERRAITEERDRATWKVVEQAAKIARIQAEAKTAGDRIEQALKWRDNRILFLQDQLAAVTTERDDLQVELNRQPTATMGLMMPC